jgi:hypothetical protein
MARSPTTTPTTATLACVPLGGKRELVTHSGENSAPPTKEDIALPQSDKGCGEYQAADGKRSTMRFPASEQPPFSNNIVSDFNNLYRAYRITMHGKSDKSAAIKYSMEGPGNLIELSDELRNRAYRMGGYHHFKVYEPKERDILSISFKDKIVLHSLCDNLLYPLFTKSYITDNYANQIGKGRHFGLDRLVKAMRSYYFKNKAAREADYRTQGLTMPLVRDYDYHEGWVIKGDIKKFFYSIDHTILKVMVIKKLAQMENKTDAAFAFWICDRVINSTPSPGIPLGVQSSHLFAILFLDGFDHFVQRIPGVEHYGRYADDFFIITKTKETAGEALAKIQEYIKGLKLQLNNKTNIFPLSHGIDFLGFHVYLTKTGKVIKKLRRHSKVHMRQRIKKFLKLLKEGRITLEKIKESYTSWCAHIQHGNTGKLKMKMDHEFYSAFPELKIQPKIKEAQYGTTARQSAHRRQGKNGLDLWQRNTMENQREKPSGVSLGGHNRGKRQDYQNYGVGRQGAKQRRQQP